MMSLSTLKVIGGQPKFFEVNRRAMSFVKHILIRLTISGVVAHGFPRSKPLLFEPDGYAMLAIRRTHDYQS